MNVKITSQQSRFLAAALLVLVVIAVIAALVWPALSLHRRYDEAITKQQDLLERYQRMVAQRPQLESALTALKKHEGRRFFLKNTAANLAGAELQEVVRAALESSGARITSSQNMAPKEDGTFNKISVNVQFSANTVNLQKALNALEEKVPYLVVDSLTVRPMNMSRNFKPVPGQEPELNVQIEVSGWAYRDGESKEGGAS